MRRRMHATKTYIWLSIKCFSIWMQQPDNYITWKIQNHPPKQWKLSSLPNPFGVSRWFPGSSRYPVPFPCFSKRLYKPAKHPHSILLTIHQTLWPPTVSEWKMEVWMICLFNWVILMFHVNFSGVVKIYTSSNSGFLVGSHLWLFKTYERCIYRWWFRKPGCEGLADSQSDLQEMALSGSFLWNYWIARSFSRQGCHCVQPTSCPLPNQPIQYSKLSKSSTTSLLQTWASTNKNL